MKKIVLYICCTCITLFGIWMWDFQKPAKADVPTGLFAEQSYQEGPLFMKRIRDTKEHVVCYVATGSELGLGISCVPEQKQ